MKFISVFFPPIFLLLAYQVNAQNTISSFDDLKKMIVSNSLSLKRGDLQLTQAKKEKLAAIFGIIEPTGHLTGSYTNNTELPVNLIPSEILGGEPGTFQEVKFGVQYITNLNAYTELKVINPQGWENLRLSRINIRVTESEGKITLKNLLENAAIVYYNIINLQEQNKVLQQNLLSADTLYSVILNRFGNGLASVQDLNDARVSQLDVEEAIKQVEYQISQQYIALKILCDIPENSEMELTQQTLSINSEITVNVETNPLIIENARDKARLARSQLNSIRYSFGPTLSLFAAYQEQQFNTRSIMMDPGKDWFTSNYVGIKVNVPLPSSERFKQTSRAKYNYLIAQNYASQISTKAVLNLKQLAVEYEMTRSQVNSSLEVFNLRNESYRKNLVNYKEGIISIEYTINSFNALVNSQIRYLSAMANMRLAEEKININNKIK